jgi:cephalosporin-C deacetylase-like acetyl esterase
MLSADVTATLARTATPAVAQGHHQWWRRWRDRVAATDAALRESRGDERERLEPIGLTHVLDSAGGVRVGARLEAPETPEAAVVVLHGYGARGPVEGRPRFAASPRLATLRLRVRGYPGSDLDTGPVADDPAGWIAKDLHDPDRAVLIAAVADVLLAARALRGRFGELPIMLRGESLGGGLAVIAAAQALDDAPIDRLVIGLPSLGDWTPRLLAEDRAGATADAARALAAAADPAPLRRTLRLADAVTHARRVRQPALCLLAAEDDVVPPSCAAAVYNALGSDPGLKRRVLIERGHAPPSRDDARTLLAFEALAGRFLEPGSDPLIALSGDLDLQG